MEFVKDCFVKIAAVITVTQALSWVFGVFDEATEIVKENQGTVVVILVLFVIINYVFYDAPKAIERIRYENKRKKVPTKRRKRKKK